MRIAMRAAIWRYSTQLTAALHPHPRHMPSALIPSRYESRSNKTALHVKTTNCSTLLPCGRKVEDPHFRGDSKTDDCGKRGAVNNASFVRGMSW